MAVERTSRRPRPRKVKLTRLSLPAQVAETLREMIVTGELEAGEKVPIAQLAGQLDVSPTPLREALKVLAAEGLVELLPNRGARVASYTVEDARHLFEVIAGIESLAAELAAQRMTEAERAELDALHAEMRGHFERGEKAEYFELNSRIHVRIIELARNEVLAGVHAGLMVRANRGRFLAITDPERWREAMDEHEELMAALRGRDWQRAAGIWRTHLQHTGRAVCTALAAAGDDADTDIQEAKHG